MSNTGKLGKEILYGVLILAGFLIVHRYVSNEMIKDEDEK
jgi:hypothetical protein|tara:strand:- start:18977 stop:19096 length:120 start_codon:yes stop_codon:yes gene_type:complete